MRDGKGCCSSRVSLVKAEGWVNLVERLPCDSPSRDLRMYDRERLDHQTWSLAL